MSTSLPNAAARPAVPGWRTFLVVARKEFVDALRAAFDAVYEGSAFVHVVTEEVSLKQVVNTNKCVIQLEKVGQQLVVHTAIDNLLKGASGQAVQNMNLMFGIEETAGLKLKANYF